MKFADNKFLLGLIAVLLLGILIVEVVKINNGRYQFYNGDQDTVIDTRTGAIYYISNNEPHLDSKAIN